MLRHWVNGSWQSADMTIHPDTANHKTNNAASHTQQHAYENFKILHNFNCFEAILCKQLNPNYNMQSHPSHITLYVRYWSLYSTYKSVDNCITQCHLNLTSEHKQILSHHCHYTLRYSARTPASYTPHSTQCHHPLHSSKPYKCTLRLLTEYGRFRKHLYTRSTLLHEVIQIFLTQGMRF